MKQMITNEGVEITLMMGGVDSRDVKIENFRALIERSNTPYSEIIGYDENNLTARVYLSYSNYLEFCNNNFSPNGKENEMQNRFIADILNFPYNEEINYGLREWFYNNVAVEFNAVDFIFEDYFEYPSDWRNLYKIVSEIFYMQKNYRGVPEKIGRFNIVNDSYNPIFKDYGIFYDENCIGYCNISNKIISLGQFADFDIFSACKVKFAEYALDNLFDESSLDEVYIRQSEKLYILLSEVKRTVADFNYYDFIMRYLDEIWDSDMLLEAVIKIEDKVYWREIKNIMKNIELSTGVVYTDLYEKIGYICEHMENIIMSNGR